jgi:hypothetical protein
MEFGIHLLSLMAENIFLDREECRVAVRWVCQRIVFEKPHIIFMLHITAVPKLWFSNLLGLCNTFRVVFKLSAKKNNKRFVCYWLESVQ